MMDDAELQALVHQAAEEAAESTVKKAMMALGVDVRNPMEVQQDMAHLRRHRQAYEQVGTITRRTALTVVIGGMLTALWLGIETMLRAPN
jgi:hypothetical protein